jgi:lipoate-protein ligase A
MPSQGFGQRMSLTFPCRLLVDPPQSGPWNMAVDEELFAAAATNQTACLRFYEWNQPTLSLGYFQNYADRSLHEASESIAVVRRQSGGGAILHHRELTYSISLPKTHSLASDAHSLYNAVHNVIVEIMLDLLPDNRPEFSIHLVTAQPDFDNNDHRFLCFERRSPGDIVHSTRKTSAFAADHKVVGSAQRRSRGAVLQHGSILLSRSEYAPELAGLNDLCDTCISTTRLVSELSTRLPQALMVELFDWTLSDQVRQSALALEKEKYGNRQWTEKR